MNSERQSGEPFIPCELRQATKGKVYPPAIVGRQRGLDDGPKRLYQLLYARAQDNPDGICWPGIELLAFDMGKCEAQVRRDCAVLIQRGLIARQRENRRKSNRYTFLWTDIFERYPSTGQPEENGSVERYGDTGQTPSLERYSNKVERYSEPVLSGITVPPNSIRNSLRGILSSLSSVPGRNEPEGRDDDNRVLEISEELLKAAQEDLYAARCCDGDGVPSEELKRKTAPPDRSITRQILGLFPTYDAYQWWVYDTAKRDLRSRAKSNGYGLYLADATNMAPDAAERLRAEQDALREEKVRQEREIEQERALKALMETPMALDAAMDVAHNQAGFSKPVPEVIKRRLQRTGDPISPNALMAAVRAHKACAACGDGGLIGSSLDRSRRFCQCIAGEELQETDPDAAAREIAEVYASLKNRMIAAATEAGYYGLDIPLKTCEIREDRDAVQIVVPRDWRIWFEGREPPRMLRAIMDRIQDPRAVQLEGI